MQNELRITTGQLEWSGGVDSNKAPTIAGPENPNGLQPNQLAWANNATVRGNGISPRNGYIRRQIMTKARFQGDFIYEPDSGLPYHIAQIGGRIYMIRSDTDYSVRDLSSEFGLTNPADTARAYFAQGEQFLVIQAGDFVTLPLFWDGATLRRSRGPAVALGVTAANFTVPAVGSSVLVTLTAPFQGSVGDQLLIGGKSYTVTEPGTAISAINSVTSFPGSVIKAGAIFQTRLSDPNPHTLIATTTADFIVPSAGVPVEVQLDTSALGTLPRNVSLFDKFGGYGGASQTTETWQLASTALPAPGANQVYVVNITDTPGDTVANGTVISTPPELPAAGPMDYYMGRMWLANGREYVAGDIVGGPSGTATYFYRDSILKLVENTYLSLGGTFRVPTNAGNIRALKHTTALDTATGEGQLLVFTRATIYSVNVVPTRAQWQALEEPIQRVVQTNHGSTSDWSIAAVNGDLFYRSINGVNSYIQADRFFGQWGNRPISVEEERAIASDNKALLGYASGINFNNRLLETCLPEESDIGTIHKGVMTLNFDLISTLKNNLPPAWEGIQEGIDFLKLSKGDYGGRERAFAFVRSRTGDLEFWEITSTEIDDTNQTGEARIIWAFELPAFTWGKPFQMKELDTMELWVDQLFGTVDFLVQFRPDQHPCWEYWHRWQVCSPRNNCEDPSALLPCDYPSTIYKPSYRLPMVLPKPPSLCQIQNARPINFGFTFQMRVFVKGKCRIRGVLVHAFERARAPYEGIVCGDTDPSTGDMPMRTI